MKKNLLKRLVFIGAIVIAGLIYWALGLDRYLTLASLKDSLEDLSILYASNERREKAFR